MRKEQFWLEVCRMKVRGYDRIPRSEKPHNLVDLQKLDASEWNQELGKIECVIRFELR
jgi:hypothetical protein